MSTRDERREFIALSEACAMRDALGAAETVEQLAALWADWLGTDCPHADEATLRDDLEDHIRDVCYYSGVHCEDVFGNDA